MRWSILLGALFVAFPALADVGDYTDIMEPGHTRYFFRRGSGIHGNCLNLTNTKAMNACELCLMTPGRMFYIEFVGRRLPNGIYDMNVPNPPMQCLPDNQYRRSSGPSETSDDSASGLSAPTPVPQGSGRNSGGIGAARGVLGVLGTIMQGQEQQEAERQAALAQTMREADELLEQVRAEEQKKETERIFAELDENGRAMLRDIERRRAESAARKAAEADADLRQRSVANALDTNRVGPQIAARASQPGTSAVATTNRAPISPAEIKRENWRLASNFPVAIALFNGWARQLAEQIRVNSGDQISIKVFEGGTIMPAYAVLDNVSSGMVPIGWIHPGYLVSKNPAFGIVGAVPFGGDGKSYIAWRDRQDVSATVERLYASLNVKALNCGVTSSNPDMMSRRAIETPLDIPGAKIRSGGLAMDVLKELGAVLEPMPIGEVGAAFASGRLDAGAMGSPAIDVTLFGLEKLGREKSVRYYYYPGQLVPAYALDLIINKPVWDGLSALARRAIESACSDVRTKALQEADAADAAGLAIIRSAGITIKPLSPGVLLAMRKGWERVASKRAAVSPEFAELAGTAASNSRPR